MSTRNEKRLRPHRRFPAGLTMIEVIVTGAVIAILALIITPPLLCRMTETKMASKIAEMNYARDLIEAHKAEFGERTSDGHACDGRRVGTMIQDASVGKMIDGTIFGPVA